MATQVQRRRGTTAQHAVFSGQLAETTIDTDKMTVVVQDGVTLGGHPLAKASDLTATNITITDAGGNFTATNVEGALAELAVSPSLVYFTAARNTTVPNTTVPAHSFIATGAETNIDAVLAPKGTGAIIANIPDNTTTGGNKRGNYAVDLQQVRNVNSQVASGVNSCVLGGERNSATATYSVSVGGYSNQAIGISSYVGGGQINTATADLATISGGDSNTASALAATIAGGTSNTASGTYSTVGGGSANYANGNFSTIPGGNGAITRTLYGKYAYASGIFVTVGDAQTGRHVLRRSTTDATPTIITADGSATSSTNVSVLPNNYSYTVSALVTARNTATGDTATWKVEGAVKRGANAAATALVGVPTVTSLGADAGMAGTAIALIADTTLGAAEIQVTGIAATTIRWVCKFDTVEVG